MQNQHHSILALATLVFLFSVAAVAQTSTTTPSSGAPQTQAAPDSQTPSQQTAPPSGAAQSHQTTVDDALQLTPDQKTKIQGVIDDENKQMGAIRDDSTLSPEQKQQKAMSVRQDGATKIKAVLSPDQLQKLAALQEKARQQQNATPSTPQ